MNEQYTGYYTEIAFWEKLNQEGRTAGSVLCYKALVLYYVRKRENIPEDVNRGITEALGYFISPDDIIPDFVPAVGYTDDMDKIIEVLKNVSEYVDEEVEQKASTALHKYFPK